MSTTIHVPETAASNDELLAQAIEKARTDLRPISRRMLALMLVQQKGLNFRDASDLVDLYCDEKAPAVPGYVSSEFGLYWLKVLAVAFAGVGLFCAYNGVRFFQTGKPAWGWFCAVTVLCGAAVFLWVRSVEDAVKQAE